MKPLESGSQTTPGRQPLTPRATQATARHANRRSGILLWNIGSPPEMRMTTVRVITQARAVGGRVERHAGVPCLRGPSPTEVLPEGEQGRASMPPTGRSTKRMAGVPCFRGPATAEVLPEGEQG